MNTDERIELEHVLWTLATREDLRAEDERLREHMTICIECVSREIHTLIDATELLKYIDSELR